MVRTAAALCALVLLVAGVAGCGEEEGVAEGAAVTVYVEAPLCGKDAEVAVIQDEDGDGTYVKLVCLPAARGPGLGQGVGGGRQVDLATAGANARRASEDSTTIAYVAPDDPGVARFTRPILEAAGIGWLGLDSPRDVMFQLVALLGESDKDDLRADVREALGQS